jgi:hypothetical protein
MNDMVQNVCKRVLCDLEQIACDLNVCISEYDTELAGALDSAFQQRSAGIGWLLTPNAALSASPVELLARGERQIVLEELGRISAGDLC